MSLVFIGVLVLLLSISCVSAASGNVPFDTSLNKTISSVDPGASATIKLAEGKYSGAANNSLHISNNKNITIIGAGVNKTIINGSNTNRLFNVDTGSSLTLINLTIANGNSLFHGGATYNTGNLTIIGSSFINSYAYNNGGAIYNYGGNLTVIDSTFMNNTARSGYDFKIGGGAIYNDYGNLTVIGSSFINNNAILAGQGGAIYNEGYSNHLNVYNSIFLNNSAIYGDGGAIYNGANNLNVYNSIFINNTLSGGSGGAIANRGNNFSVDNSSFINNNANSGHGGAIYNTGNFTAMGSSFMINNASYGTAIYNTGKCDVSYSSFYNIRIQLYNTGNATANYNWWNYKSPQSLTYNVSLSSWFVMLLNSSSTSNVKVGDTFKYGYYFLLNNSSVLVKDANVFKLPKINVTIIYNGAIVKVLDGRSSTNLSLKVNNINNIIIALVKPVNNNSVVTTSLLFSASKNAQLSTKLIAPSDFKGSSNRNTVLKTTLKDLNGKALLGKIISLYVDGKWVYDSDTNSNGVASFNYKAGTGSYKIDFKFKGDSKYKSSAVSSTLVVSKVSKAYQVLMTNVLSTKVGNMRFTSYIKNKGPGTISAKVTYKVSKDVWPIVIRTNMGYVAYNRKTKIATFIFRNISKNSKTPIITMSLNSRNGANIALYPKFTSKNKVEVKQVNIVK
ncbi:MAG: hypothetical protein ACRC1M_00775 [Methanobacteriaceae archaeon]